MNPIIFFIKNIMGYTTEQIEKVMVPILSVLKIQQQIIKEILIIKFLDKF
jgi:hypothetical protein